ncbi:hypothetical protein BDF14DRAFT_1782251 [Spinellus fusiger]|nr:hypothetical protein BDF14DRAFT_1782251 [Spinellus fusiger]
MSSHLYDPYGFWCCFFSLSRKVILVIYFFFLWVLKKFFILFFLKKGTIMTIASPSTVRRNMYDWLPSLFYFMPNSILGMWFDMTLPKLFFFLFLSQATAFNFKKR